MSLMAWDRLLKIPEGVTKHQQNKGDKTCSLLILVQKHTPELQTQEKKKKKNTVTIRILIKPSEAWSR